MDITFSVQYSYSESELEGESVDGFLQDLAESIMGYRTPVVIAVDEETGDRYVAEEDAGEWVFSKLESEGE